MSAKRREDDLDTLIAEIIVDCYDEGEELMGFENAFDEEAHFLCPGRVVGEEVQLLSVATHDGRRELIATCERQGRSYRVALFDIELKADPATARILAACRQWAANR